MNIGVTQIRGAGHCLQFLTQPLEGKFLLNGSLQTKKHAATKAGEDENRYYRKW